MTDTIEPLFGGSTPAPGNSDNAGNAGNPLDNSNSGQTPDGDNALAGNNGNQPVPNYLDALSPENRKIAESKGWKDPNDAFKSYSELNKRFAQGLNPETGDDGSISPEAWDDFGKRVGAPDKAEYYEFSRPDVPDYVTYDDGLEGKFREVMHKYKANKPQAAAMHKELSEYLVGQQIEHHKQVSSNIANTSEMVAREFGGAGSPAFREAVKGAFESIKGTPGLLEAYVQSGILIPAEGGKYHVTNPAVIMHHANTGAALYSESEGFSGLNGDTDDTNPFSDQHENVTAQGQIITRDRNLAIRLIRAAGKDPSEFGI